MPPTTSEVFLESFEDLGDLVVVEHGPMIDTIGFYAKVEYPPDCAYSPKRDAQNRPESVAMLRAVYYPSQQREDGSYPLYCEAGWWHPRDTDRMGTRLPRVLDWGVPIDLDFLGFRVLPSGSIVAEDGKTHSGYDLFSFLLKGHCRTGEFLRWTVYATWRSVWLSARLATSLATKLLAGLIWLLGSDVPQPVLFGDLQPETANVRAGREVPEFRVDEGEVLSVFGYSVPRRLALCYFTTILLAGVSSYFWLYELCPACYRFAKGMASINLLSLAVAVLGVAVLKGGIRPAAIWLIERLYRLSFHLLFRGFSTRYYRMALIIGVVTGTGLGLALLLWWNW